MIWSFVVLPAVCAFWGLVAAWGIRWARKERTLPKWPILTGVLFGLLAAVLDWR